MIFFQYRLSLYCEPYEGQDQDSAESPLSSLVDTCPQDALSKYLLNESTDILLHSAWHKHWACSKDGPTLKGLGINFGNIPVWGTALSPE